MKNTIPLICLTAALCAALAACVSKKEHEELRAQSVENARLLVEKQSGLDAAQREVKRLKTELKDRDDEILRLEESTATLAGALTASQGKLQKLVAELQAQKEQLQTTVAEFEREKAELEAAEKEKLEAFKKTQDELVKELRGEIKSGEIQITRIKNKLTVNVAERIFFASGKAAVKPGGRRVLLRVGRILKRAKGKQIRVEGHTDNLPIGDALKDRFPTNWELSTARATHVVRFLEERAGIDPALIYAAGFGPHRPVASNKSKLGRSKNRRIEIVLVDREVGKKRRPVRKRGRKRSRKPAPPKRTAPKKQ